MATKEEKVMIGKIASDISEAILKIRKMAGQDKMYASRDRRGNRIKSEVDKIHALADKLGEIGIIPEPEEEEAEVEAPETEEDPE